MTRRRLAAMNHPTDRLVGHSPSIRALRAQIRRLVAFDTLGNPSVPTLLRICRKVAFWGILESVSH